MCYYYVLQTYTVKTSAERNHCKEQDNGIPAIPAWLHCVQFFFFVKRGLSDPLTNNVLFVLCQTIQQMCSFLVMNINTTDLSFFVWPH